jgi:soluble lytic murein transglycosylase-like protein
MTVPALRSLTAMLCFVTVLVLMALSSNAAYAGRASLPPHRASSEPLQPFAAFVTEASRRFGLPEHWIRAVMHVESSERPRARSRKGAIGLMQIMPPTWADLRTRYGLGADPYDVRDNILAGAAYMRELHDRYGAPGFLAAYNAGPGRYERHLATGRPLPDETRAYIAALAPMISPAPTKVQPNAVARSFAWANASLFATRSAGSPHDGRSPVDLRQDRSSRAHAVVDLSALVPQSGNLFVRLTREMRSP